MSYSSHFAAQPHHQAVAARGQSAAAVSRSLQNGKKSDYTLVHGGRHVRIGPVAFWIVVGTLVIMAGWSIATGSYFAFREDVLTRLIGRQADMQFAYEDRIADMRAQVDRITSRQLLDQEQFEQKLNALLKRQAEIERRTNALSADGIVTGSIKPQRSAAEKPLKPSPINDTVIYTAPPDREARLESRDVATGGATTVPRARTTGLDGVLTRVTLALDKVEARQGAVLTLKEEKADGEARRIRSVLDDLGVRTGKTAVGGPFVPAKAPGSGASVFERQLYRIALAQAQVISLKQTLVAVPVSKPVEGEIELTSSFGVRPDPFLRRAAMHTGLDMRGDTGDPVHATANGKVVTAGREGGYGNMIEIDHGNGFATRYGHLSAIDVKVGQAVRIGQVIGRIGSTGRSTGPHLHYETRINDEAVDPQKFLRAGVRLGTL